MFKIALFLALTLLSGCATTGGYERLLASWVDSSEIELVRAWGIPSSAYQAGSSKFLVYADSQTVYIPGTAPTYTSKIVGNTVYTRPNGGRPAQNIGSWCTTTFEVVNERVVSWRWQGNACRAAD